MLHRLHADVDPVSVVKQQQPGVQLVEAIPQAKALPKSQLVALLLLEQDGAKPIQPAGIPPEGLCLGHHIHHIKVPIGVLGDIGIGSGAFQIGRYHPLILPGTLQNQFHHFRLTAHAASLKSAALLRE